MRIHEVRTALTPAEVIARARRFFGLAGSSYAAFEEEASDSHIKLFLEVGEVVIGCVPQAGATVVRGSASRGEHLLTRFLTTLGPPLAPRQALHRHGLHEVRGVIAQGSSRLLGAGGA